MLLALYYWILQKIIGFFFIQDAVQGHHWDTDSNSQCSLHAIVLYIKENEKPVPHFYCIVSDQLKYNTVAVHALLEVFLDFTKKKYPWLNQSILKV
jgi:hypothetical protein